MKRRSFAHFCFVCVVLLIPGLFGSGRVERLSRASAVGLQSEVSWLAFIPGGEEFSVMIPAPPSRLIQPANYSLEKGGETILARRSYGGYSSGFVFTIESYRAGRPERILDRLIDYAGLSASSPREIVVGGIKGREYRRAPTKFYSRVICLMTKEHVYFLTLATREENHPFLDHFLSSFRLRQPQDKETAENFAPDTLDLKPNEVFEPKDLTSKAVIVWKPLPSYTEQARRDGLTGTIVLEAIFASNGYVTNIKVNEGLKDGLTEKAVEVARNIRFFPGEKDGKPASQ